MGIIDIELYHMSRGKMENPKKLRNYDQPCGFSWDYHRKNYTTATQDRSSTQVSIDFMGSHYPIVGQRVEHCKEMFSDFLRRYSESYRIIVSLMTLVVVVLR